VHLVHDWNQGDAIKVASKETLDIGRWQHVFVTYDGSAKAAGVRIFLDGKLGPVKDEKDALKGSLRTTVPLKIGQRHSTGLLAGWIADVRIYDRQLSHAEVAHLAARHPAYTLVALPEDERTKEEEEEIAACYRHLDPALQEVRNNLARLQSDLGKIRPVTTMVMQERKEPRETFLQVRGDYRQKGKPVKPEVPAVLHPFPENAPRNRLGLAQWLVDSHNPLVGRVTMNRTWAVFFGRGLVTTPEDFGTQGERPTHPELLDWLATEFIAQQWRMKAMHRLIVTSATYRQASTGSAELLRRDPLNQLYARGPRFRLEYEVLRDQALAVSGLLSPKIGGPSVMPPQPPGIWENSFGFYDLPNFRWKEATGEDRYRRGIYTFLRRTAMYPSMLLFDAPTREVCSVRRLRTNTPLQALATLNDPVFVEAAGGLAQRIMKEGGTTWETQIDYAFQVCLCRSPRPQELARLRQLHDQALERFRKDTSAAALLVKHSRLEPKGQELPELAAWIVVANVLMNLDEMLTRG
jgi:hypothetical protein